MAMKYVSRAQWGARAYRLPGGATLYSGTRRRGVKLHYLGGPYSDRPHGECAAYVRKIQADHMDRNGWSDIGYSHVVCTHGYVYEGRGLKRRNSANGSTTLNDQDYAVLLLVGTSGVVKPTDAQLHGGRDAIDYCRSKGPAGAWLGGHRDGYATACPGPAVYAWAKAGAPRPGGDVPIVIPKEEDMPLTAADAKTLLTTDGIIANGGPDAETNPKLTAAQVLNRLEVLARRTEKKVDVLSAANAELVKTVGVLAAGLGDLDPAAVVAELRAALEAIDIRIDVPDSPAS